MIAGVAHTHAALWYLFGDPRLSAPAKAAFDAAVSSRRKIVLLSAWRTYADLKTALHDPDHVLQEAPVTAEIIDTMLEVPRVDILICRTALSRRLPYILACQPSVAMAAYALPTYKPFGRVSGKRLIVWPQRSVQHPCVASFWLAKWQSTALPHEIHSNITKRFR
jgi:hypothetical protein